MVFIMWHVIRHDSPLLTWILNLITQFISCLQMKLAVVKVDHRIRDCVLGKDTGSYCFCCLKDKEHTHTHCRQQTDRVHFIPITVNQSHFISRNPELLHASIQIHDDQFNGSHSFPGFHWPRDKLIPICFSL